MTKKIISFAMLLLILIGTLAFSWLAFTVQRPLSQIGGVVCVIFELVLIHKLTGEPRAETWQQIDKSSREGGYW